MVTWACQAAATDWSASADLLHGGDEADGGHADTAPLLWHQHPEQAEGPHLAEEVGRAARLVPGRGSPEGDLVLGEVAAQRDQLAFGFAQREIHSRHPMD